MKRRIRKVAVLGSGIMGSRIACHFANIGVQVLLLDIVPKDAGDSKEERNALVNNYLKEAIKSNPSPVYSKRSQFTGRIQTGNFDDDLDNIADCDWVIEAIIERLDIKKQMFDKVEKFRKPGSLISSNTSGIPISMLAEGRSDDFNKHFCGTHFFNPPRYLKLLEIIPGPSTSQEVLDFHADYGQRFLGKVVVQCKDTPAFIANRIGVFSIMSLFHTVKEMGLTVKAVDKLTGPVLGRPKSATFRTCDVVGLDTLIHVADGLKENVPNDESKEFFEQPDFIQHMIGNNLLGSKTKAGFYKKVKENGESVILELDLNDYGYKPSEKFSSPTLEMTKTIDDLKERYPVLFMGQDKAGEFYRKTFSMLFRYVSMRIPEIADEIYKVDDAMRAGFGWELGPFESWDAIGVEESVKVMEELGHKPAAWVYDMISSGANSFYRLNDGFREYYDPSGKTYKRIPGQEDQLSLEILIATSKLWENNDATIVDMGDGIIGLEFHTKMNTIDGGVVNAINKAIDMAEEQYDGLVIYNEGQNFSAGANVGMIFMMAIEQDWDELAFAVKSFQDTMMRIRYSDIPVVVAPHNMALGGGCEMSMHADKVVAHAELYMGLVEFGVGVIPGGGGSKEFALRLSDELHEGDMRTNQFRNRFLTIGQAKVSTSALEAFEHGYLRHGIDEYVVSREMQLTYAKTAARQLADKGYTRPIERADIKVLGQEGLGLVYAGANSMLSGNYMSEHDQLISHKLGFVLSGGDLTGIQEVSEQYLLDMERKAFIELCGTRKTMERMQSLVKTGKILRN